MGPEVPPFHTPKDQRPGSAPGLRWWKGLGLVPRQRNPEGRGSPEAGAAASPVLWGKADAGGNGLSRGGPFQGDHGEAHHRKSGPRLFTPQIRGDPEPKLLASLREVKACPLPNSGTREGRLSGGPHWPQECGDPKTISFLATPLPTNESILRPYFIPTAVMQKWKIT